MHVAVTYTVTDDNVFLIETEATSDQNHSAEPDASLLFQSGRRGLGIDRGSSVGNFCRASSFLSMNTYTATGRLESTHAHGNRLSVEPRRLGDVIPSLFQEHGDLYALPEHEGAEADAWPRAWKILRAGA